MIEHLIEAFGDQFVILAIIYFLVVVMVFLDLWSGVRKAKRSGEYSGSYGLRKTVDKLAKYLNVMLLLTVLDIVQMLAVFQANPQVPFNFPLLPILTFGGAIFFGYIEIKSMMENAEEKDKGRYQDAAKTIKKIMEDKNAREIISDVLNNIKTEKKDDNITKRTPEQ